MQQLNVNLSIPVPDDQVLITKVELEELQRQELSGVYWNMKDLEKRIGRKQEWIKENILYSSRFKKTLEEFVYYPKGKGQSWSFQAIRMATFLDTNFSRIFGR